MSFSRQDIPRDAVALVAVTTSCPSPGVEAEPHGDRGLVVASPVSQTCVARWSPVKLRFLATMSILGAAAGLPLLGAADRGLRTVGLLWCGALACGLIELYRRAREHKPVLVIDPDGICDRRILGRPIAWWEIAYVFPLNSESSRVVELQLRYAGATFASRGWAYRCLRGPIDRLLRRLHLPDVCISLVLLDASATQVLAAIARHRPDLVPREYLPGGYEPRGATWRATAPTRQVKG